MEFWLFFKVLEFFIIRILEFSNLEIFGIVKINEFLDFFQFVKDKFSNFGIVKINKFLDFFSICKRKI